MNTCASKHIHQMSTYMHATGITHVPAYTYICTYTYVYGCENVVHAFACWDASHIHIYISQLCLFVFFNTVQLFQLNLFAFLKHSIHACRHSNSPMNTDMSTRANLKTWTQISMFTTSNLTKWATLRFNFVYLLTYTSHYSVRIVISLQSSDSSAFLIYQSITS